MNDLQSVRALYDDPPAPSAHAVAAARLRMTEGPRRAPGPRRRALPFALGLTSAATATAATVALLPGGDSARPAPSPRAMAPEAVLLAAATTAEREPASGRYWFSRRILGGHSAVKDRDYLVDRRVEREIWIPTSGREHAWTIERPLGGRPLDEAAWRRDGSPRSWRLIARIGDALNSGPTETGNAPPGAGEGVPVPAEPGERYAVPKSLRPGWFGRLGPVQVTPGSLRRLPDDPAGLRAYMEQVIRRMEQGGHRRFPVGGPEHGWLMYDFTLRLLTDLPARPAVRAAAFRVLATLPGVVSRGQVTDPRGRRGQALAMRVPRYFAEPGGERRIVVDPATGRLLAVQDVVTQPDPRYRERPGQLVLYSVILEARWTDAAPDLPEKRHMVDRDGDPRKPACARC
ncbi:CU044_5270 family protein [Actinomadura kijaniata]|uniref:CU044_5270 family protein n=1 Tax=Actinomadura namibiensis TaxID=182080 RepID=A0A7W3QKN5_ACTNM|nr:CU044_5270 family protein [Actinomadura namibiensis]MBA8950128.1 hypothetical protein [Actinomadura namibiensis]